MLDRVLTLDLGTKCGWATLRTGRVESGMQTFDLKRGESPGMRYIRFNAWLDFMFSLTLPQMVAYEMAHHRGGFATELLIGMVTRVEETCARWVVDYTKVHSQTLKKFITGTGRAEKLAVIEAVNKKYGTAVIDDNEADALAIMAWVENEFGIQWTGPKP